MPEQSVLLAVATAFGLDGERLIHVGGNVNDLYEYPSENGVPARILRVSDQSWHTAEDCLAAGFVRKTIIEALFFK